MKLDINREKVKRWLRLALSPAFILSLLGALILWYTTKLGHTYNHEMPLNVRIDGQKYRLTAIVNGRGSTITAQQLGLKRTLNLSLSELQARPSREISGALTITPASLQTAINAQIKDLTVSQVVEAPEFTPQQ